MSRYKAYPEYKDSGVIGLDRLPFDWSVKKVKHILTLGVAQ
jgi:type I restriction enzyme S subunit